MAAQASDAPPDDSAAVRRALHSWTSQLIDTSARNRLLYFKPLKRGTLDFGPDSSADQPVADALLRGSVVRLSNCFPDDGGADASQRARSIQSKARVHEEEQGIRTLYLGWGLATWEQVGSGPTPNAPVLLAAAELTPQGRIADDFTLGITDDWEVNPTLVHLLKRDFDVELDEAAQTALLDTEPLDGASVFEQLERRYLAVSGFRISDGLVLGTFSYAKLPMVRDLEGATAAVTQHPLVAAIAGDRDAQATLRISQQRDANNDGSPSGDALPPRNEFLVLDADGTQSEVINAALSGANLVVVGPPGTGKSQTIANLLATLTASGRSSLFVAEKRAAIDAVLKRLNGLSLGHLVLDLHEGMRSRRQTAEQLASALEAAHTAPEPNVASLHRTLLQNREKLSRAEQQLHQPRSPWGLSIYELQSRLLGMGGSRDTGMRLRGPELNALSGEALEQAQDELREYVNLGGAALDASEDAPWSAAHRAATVRSPQHVSEAAGLLDELRDELLLKLERELSLVAQQLDVEVPATIRDARSLLSALAQAQATQPRFTAAVFEADIDALIDQLQPDQRGALGRLWARLLDARYRAALDRTRALLPPGQPPASQLRARMLEFSEVREAWRSAAHADPTVKVWSVSADQCVAALEQFSNARAGLQELAALGDAELDWAVHRRQLDALQRDRRMLFQLPRLQQLRIRLQERGLTRLAEAAHQRGSDGSEAVQAFEQAWTRSVLDAVWADAPEFAAFDAAGHSAAVVEFCSADRRHIQESPARVVRAWAEAAVVARDTHPEQSQLIMREAKKKRRHLPTRELFAQAPDVLTALKPCWVMSPLVVAQLLPLGDKPPFDVVVFDEASQIPPADAVSALLRGRQAIVAGDPKQLPPSSFFTSSSEDEDEENDQDAPLTEDVESILDAMSALLPIPWGTRTLGWHYRSRDERLIAFSNHHVYDGGLTTFPGAVPDDCIQHVEVRFAAGAPSVSGSYSPEVERVVELILRHAVEHPDESLGVIALGSTHATRIAETVRLKRRDRPELDEFFSEANPEPFFVKNLERVQGDERDAIILTIGYGRAPDGRMRYNFGPINQEGGFRRLNVAVTRAKRRMTAVSCFSADDMDPDRIHNDGVRMLRNYIAYAQSGGRQLGAHSVDPVPLNPFEIDIKERLEARGLNVQPQYGVSGYRIDFAVMHPQEPGRPVLAIEADGAQYHSAPATRDRDRLRQENLERLGWKFHRIWSTEWFDNPELEADRAFAAYERALAADATVKPPAAPASTVAALDPSAPEAPLQRSGQKPNLPQGVPILEHEQADLVDLVRWIKSDGRLRTEGELITECLVELGYRRRGSRIVEVLQSAIAAARRDQSADESKPLPSASPTSRTRRTRPTLRTRRSR